MKKQFPPSPTLSTLGAAILGAVALLPTAAPASANDEFGAEQLYQALNTKEESVQFRQFTNEDPTSDVKITEKNRIDLLCRKYEPKESDVKAMYECFFNVNINAQQKYASMQTPAYAAFYSNPLNGAPRMGVNVLEKKEGGLFCQQYQAVSPNPAPWFYCYNKLIFQPSAPKQET